MDRTVTSKFATEKDAKQYADSVFADVVQKAIDDGYTVIAGEIVGKNAMTGEDEPGKQHTIAWDDPQSMEDGSFSVSNALIA